MCYVVFPPERETRIGLKKGIQFRSAVFDGESKMKITIISNHLIQLQQPVLTTTGKIKSGSSSTHPLSPASNYCNCGPSRLAECQKKSWLFISKDGFPKLFQYEKNPNIRVKSNVKRNRHSGNFDSN